MKNGLLARRVGVTILLALSNAALAGNFVSGSTGADGNFSPTTDVALQVPPSGIFNFTDVNIPSGVTVTFVKNATNSPVVMLATGNVVVTGTIDISGKSAVDTKYTQISYPEAGAGGPGGFSGGRGGDAMGHGGQGFGPGGGRGGNTVASPCNPEGGGGAGYFANGEASYCFRAYGSASNHGTAGPSYGSNTMLPLLGGSGGGGGAGAASASGAPGGGGGGGGGALLIAATKGVAVMGNLLANGGNGAGTVGCSWTSNQDSGSGGGGSGGFIRILTPSYSGGGKISVAAGASGCPGSFHGGGSGSVGRYSVETLIGGTLSFAGLPTVNITKVAGVAVPAIPTGASDVSLPLSQANPVVVDIAASNIPLAATIKLTMTPVHSGDAISVDASPLSGSFENSTTSASISIPNGPSVLMAQVSYTLTVVMGEALSTYAMGERVERVMLSAVVGGESKVTLITVSGRQFDVPPVVMSMIPAV